MATPAPTSLALLLLAITSCDDFTGTIEPGSGPDGDLLFDNLPIAEATEAFSRFRTLQRWQKDDLAYYVGSLTSSLPPDLQREIFAEAAEAWTSVTPLTISEVSNPADADFVVGFGVGAHCGLYQIASLACPSNPEGRLDGPGDVLAHAYFPGQGPISGEAHFDDQERWVARGFGGVSLLSVAIHELGHSLGLDHSDVVQSIMYWRYDDVDVKEELRADDIAGIQALYGAGGPPPPPPPPPDKPPTVQPCGPPQPGDQDGDGVPDTVELYQLRTNPAACDTDRDGLPDFEAAYGLNPLNPDTDGDGVSDGEEVRTGSNPFVPDQGSGGAGAVGLYQGRDSFNSPLRVRLFADGSAQGALTILYFGVPTDIALAGGITTDGLLLLLSYDYFFAYQGAFVPNGLQGRFQTAGGAFGTWSASRVSLVASEESVGDLTHGGALTPSSEYQPTIGRRVQPTMQVHRRVPTMQLPR